jgi:putative acetyltransferase
MGWSWRSRRLATGITKAEAALRPLPAHILRPIEPRDDATIERILRSVMSEFGADGAGSSIGDPEVSAMWAAYSGPRSAYFLVESEAQVIGGGGIGPLRGAAFEVCELRKMYFLPQARGQGMGQVLLRRCLRAARGFGYRTCYLETLTGMHGAQRLYARAGFASMKAPLGATGHFGCDRYLALEL